MQTTRLAALCLEPPGPVLRELSLFRRRLFFSRGEASFRAFPDFAFLAFGSCQNRTALRGSLSRIWEGIDGEFSLGGLAESDACLWLTLQGPTEELGLRARSLLGAAVPGPFPEGRGFFLGQHQPGSTGILGSLHSPPTASFSVASILLLELEWSGFSWGAWQVISRIPRLRRTRQPGSGRKA